MASKKTKAAVTEQTSGKWTEAQLDAIRAQGQSVLVSAAAGSGKTSVLAERCAYLVGDAPQRCGVNQLLVVTFTEAAAGEMRDRVEKALREAVARRPEDLHLRRQVALMEQIQCSTLHSFCSRLIRQHFHRLGIDPGVRTLDGDEAQLMRVEVVGEMFLDHYEGDASADFQALVDAFGDGRDERLGEKVIRLHELRSSLVDGEAWSARAMKRIEEGAGRPLGESEIGAELMARVTAQLDDAIRGCADAGTRIKPLGPFEKYLEFLRDLYAQLKAWQKTLRTQGYDALVEAVGQYEAPRLPSVSGSVSNKDTAKNIVEQVRDRRDAVRGALKFSEADIREGLASIVPHARVLLGLVDDFGRRYAREKDAARVIDFNDLERLALRLLKEDGPGLVPSAAAESCHKAYHHVLVDEYQDINELQDTILKLVSRECLAEAGRRESNLFCVGDVKQSIYRFRLAEPSLFLARESAARAGQAKAEASGQTARARVIDLQANFRSRGPLLEVLNGVFSRLMTREAAELEYDQSHYLHAMADYPQAGAGEESFAGAPVELYVLPPAERVAEAGLEEGEGPGKGEDAPEDLEKTAREGLQIAQIIDDLMGRGERARRRVYDKAIGAYRPIELRDIVILLRATRFHSDQYAQQLQGRGIAVHNQGGTGYFEAMEVRDVLSLLRLLDNRRQDVPMAAVLRSPLSGLPGTEDALGRIRLAYPRVEGQADVPFHEAVVRYAHERGDELAAKLRDFLSELDGLREIARQRPVAELVWSIYERTGYLSFCSGLDGGAQRCANLIELYDRAHQFGSFSKQGLTRFIRFLESLRDEADLAPASPLSAAENVVRIMSVHKSKGLEFPVVILAHAGKKINMEGCSGSIIADRQALLGLEAVDLAKQVRYPSLAHDLVGERLKRQTLAEELRVLYVAMTRAKEQLIVVGTAKKGQVEVWDRTWARHEGPLPAGDVLDATSMLDWIGPVAAALGPEKISVFDVPAEEIAKWRGVKKERAGGVAAALASLEPLAQKPAADAVAEEIIGRLTRTYEHEASTVVAASRSVTAMTKGSGDSGRADESSRRSDGARAGKTFNQAPLPTPRFLSESGVLSAADRGTAVHRFLEHADFTRTSDGELATQLADLGKRRIMSEAEVKAVDLAVVRWFLDTALGRKICAAGNALLRELPVNVPVEKGDGLAGGAGGDPLDRVMLRGRIDLLVPDGENFLLVDYKTDAVNEQTIDARVEVYRPQLGEYAKALGAITGRTISGRFLVFLAARRVVEV